MLSKFTTIQAFAILAAVAEAHYYSQTDAVFDAEVQKLNKQTQDVLFEIRERQNAADFAENEAAIALIVADAKVEAAAAMADRVKVEAALAWVRGELADIQEHQAAAEAAQLAAETAKTEAETAETAAKDAQADAEAAQAAAETAETNAQASQAAAEMAQSNAETSQSTAEFRRDAAGASASNATTQQGLAEQQKDSGKTYRDEAEAAATAAGTAATNAKGFGDAAKASGDAALASGNTAGDSGTAATSAKTAAEEAASKAGSHASLALYNSWGTIEDHDYNFLTYPIWGEYQWRKHQDDLEALGYIDEEREPTDNLFYQGKAYTIADDGAQCQRLTFNEDICHGSGFFVKDGVDWYVQIHKGRVFRVYENTDPEDLVYFCHEDSCNTLHGPYSSAGKSSGPEMEKTNYLYNEGDLVGYSNAVDFDMVKGVFFEKPAEFPLTVSAMSNVCPYFDLTDTAGIAPEYADYCTP